MLTSNLRYLIYGIISTLSLSSIIVSAGTEDGVFGDYFTRMIWLCPASSVVTGFDTNSNTYGARQCKTISEMIGSIFGSSPSAQNGQAIVGFNSDGTIKYGDVGVFVRVGNNIAYTWGNVGIGMLSPTKKLDIIGDINITGDFYRNGVLFWSSQWMNSGNNIYNTNIGNVGIGTNLPAWQLDIKNKNTNEWILHIWGNIVDKNVQKEIRFGDGRYVYIWEKQWEDDKMQIFWNQWVEINKLCLWWECKSSFDGGPWIMKTKVYSLNASNCSGNWTSWAYQSITLPIYTQSITINVNNAGTYLHLFWWGTRIWYFWRDCRPNGDSWTLCWWWNQNPWSPSQQPSLPSSENIYFQVIGYCYYWSSHEWTVSINYYAPLEKKYPNWPSNL